VEPYPALFVYKMALIVYDLPGIVAAYAANTMWIQYKKNIFSIRSKHPRRIFILVPRVVGSHRSVLARHTFIDNKGIRAIGADPDFSVYLYLTTAAAPSGKVPPPSGKVTVAVAGTPGLARPGLPVAAAATAAFALATLLGNSE